MQRFSSTGEFERAWGKDVVIAGRAEDSGTGFEICTIADDCQSNSNSTIINLGRAPLGGELFEPSGIAVDPADGSVYVAERQNFRVQKFTGDGEFVLAWGRNVVKDGGVGDVPQPPVVVNERQQVALFGPFSFGCFCSAPVTGGTFTLTFAGETTDSIPYDATAAVVDQHLEDDLPNIDVGEVMVAGGPGPSSAWTVEFAGDLGGADQPQMTGNAGGLSPAGSFVSVSTTQAGSTTLIGPAEVCTVAADCQQGEAGTLGGEFANFGSNGSYPAVVPAGNPNAGNVVVPDPGNRRVQEFTSEGAFVRAFGADVDSPSGGTAFEVCTVAANCKVAASSGSASGQFASNQPTRAAVDSTGAIYTVESGSPNFRVQKFTPQAGPPALAPTIFLTGVSSTTPTDVAIGAADNVLVSRSSPAGASTCPSGSPSGIERRVHEYTAAGAEIADSLHMACAGIPSGTTNGLAYNADSGDIYVSSLNRVYVLGASSPPTVSMAVGAVGTHTAALTGLVNPGGPDTAIGVRTQYHWEYFKTSTPAALVKTPVPDADVGNGFSNVVVSLDLTGLEADTSYTAKLVASKPFSGLASIETPPQTFTTSASRPDIDAAYVTSRDTTSATLNATINPNNEATTYHFEYGPTVAYGTTVPAPDASAGGGGLAEHFDQPITGLHPATTYHYRVVATNSRGTVRSPNKTFTTRPAAQAPDGRAYELVSPADKVGGTGVGAWYAGVGSHGNTGVAAYEGERFASMSYYGASLVDGAFSFGADWSLAERTPSGWANKPAFNRSSGHGTSEFAKVPGMSARSDDLSLTAWFANSSLALFDEMEEAWAGTGVGASTGHALRDWETGRWEMAAPWEASQQTAGSADLNAQAAAGGGYLLISGGVRGAAGPGDPTNPAFTGNPADFVCPVVVCNFNVYIDDVSAGLSDTFPGEGIRSLVSVCTGTGMSRTEIPAVIGGKVAPTACPARLLGRDARMIDPRGSSMAASAWLPGHVSADGSRVFFMSPDHTKAANRAPCSGIGADTSCPPQVYVRQRNADGTVVVRWISRSMVAGQDATLLSTVAFEGATPDGDKVFFRTASPLTEDDPNGGSQVPGGVKTGTPHPQSVDLFMYDLPDAPGADPGEGTLTRLSAGPTGNSDPGVATVENDNVTALRAFGADGRRVYFATGAPLAGVAAPTSGTVTTPGGSGRSLYLYDAAAQGADRWRFIAQLPASSTLGSCASSGAQPNGSGLVAGGVGLNGLVQHGGTRTNCTRATPDGAFLTFFSDGRLTADDPDAVTGDVYGYDALADELIRLSAPDPGAPGGSYECITDGLGGGLGTRCYGDLAVVSKSPGDHLQVATGPAGPAVFFESASRLVAEDRNDVYDVYQWRDSELTLISTGAEGAEPALYRGNDRSGRNVYFTTRDPLTWQDPDTLLDVYTARVGGGITQPAAPPAACSALAGGCQSGGFDAVSTDTKTSSPVGRENASAERRKRLALAGLSKRARRRAARRGVLAVRVRTSRAGVVRVLARAKIGKRTRRVAGRKVRVRKAGAVTVRLRLNRAAKRRLRSGRALRVTLRVASRGARTRTATVRLKRGRRS